MTPVPFLLLIEDDDAIRTGLELALTRQGHRVVSAASGEEGLERLREQRPDLIVLDVMLPGIDGFEVCRRIRRSDQLPIILLTARSDDIDVVVGLESGADDYVVKPIQPRVLDARIRAVLRRGQEPGSAPSTLLEGGPVRMDVERHVVTVDEVEQRLPLKEFDLLEMFLRNPGRVLTRSQLIDRVWGADYVGDTKTLDVHVKRLRAKLEPDPGNPRLLVTVRGLGYKLDL